jgi:hypothetical protein
VVYPSDDAVADFPPPPVVGSKRPPGVVVAAAVVTWTAASITAAFALCFGVLVLLFGDPVFDVFEGQNLQAYVVAVVDGVMGLSAAADVLAYLVFRGHRWARWALVVLSVASAVYAAMLGYYVAPLVITAAALAVVVLLFLKPARAWLRSGRP